MVLPGAHFVSLSLFSSVTACGLPTPRKDHAPAMARFANDCLLKMHTVVKKLEVLLGPG